MPTIDRNALLDQAIADNQQLIESVKLLQGLSAEKLRQQPTPKKWSALECFEHIILSNQLYIDRIEAVLNKGDLPKMNGKTSFSTGIFGQMMVNNMQPTSAGKIKMPMKTFPNLVPTTIDKLDVSIIEDFIKQQETMIDLIKRSREAHLEKVRIVSAAGPILKFKLGDAFRFLVAHSERHVLQAKRAAGVA